MQNQLIHHASFLHYVLMKCSFIPTQSTLPHVDVSINQLINVMYDIPNKRTLQSALSFRKLRAMKIKDRSSFHVIILNADLATPESLSSQQLFGQFGAIASIRILKDTSPREAHIRFANEDAAAQAIEWCNNQSPLFVNAKYGYQKYCVKFINNQPCDIPGCAMRHSWSDTRDILNFRSLTPAGIDPCM